MEHAKKTLLFPSPSDVDRESARRMQGRRFKGGRSGAGEGEFEDLSTILGDPRPSLLLSVLLGGGARMERRDARMVRTLSVCSTHIV